MTWYHVERRDTGESVQVQARTAQEAVSQAGWPDRVTWAVNLHQILYERSQAHG